MKLTSLLVATAAAVGLASSAIAVTTTVYSGHTNSGDGTPFAGPVGTLTTAGITFGTDTGFNWHPFGLPDFGSRSLSTINVSTAGTYTFTLTSDDGSIAYIDGAAVVSDPDSHGPATVMGSAFLTAGSHSLDVNFFECCGGPSGVDFTLPGGVSYVPEPASWALMVLGFGGLGTALRLRNRSAAVPT